MLRLSPLFVLLCVLALGCGNSSDPEAEYRALEERLLGAQSVSFDFQVVAEGVLEADLRGTVSTNASGAVTMDAAGSFIGTQVQMRMITDGDSLRMSTDQMSDAVALPEDVYRAMILGLTRMGIMHNAAMLTTVSPPEHGDGGIDAWVTIQDFETRKFGETSGIGFEIYVEGQRTSGAVLALEEGLPTQRRQVVEFPGGAMEVLERYSNFVVRD